jgi:tetratricopeptide (TPR) repeat protein
VWAAQDALRRYDFGAALDHLEVRAGRWPGRASIYLLAARTARRASAYDKAEHYLAAFKDSGSADPDTVLLESLLLPCQQGNLSPALERQLAALLKKNHEDSALILEALGQGLMLQMRYPEALACIRRCLEREPENGQALLLQALVCERLTRIGDAVDSYRRLVDLYPGHWDGQLGLAGALLAAGETEQAAGRLKALYRDRPDDPGVLLGLALCHGEAGRQTEACELLDRLLAADRTNRAALIERGRLALDMDDPVRAEGWLQRAVDLAPSDRQANQLLYVCLREQGKEAAAAQQQARVTRLLNDERRRDDILRHEMSRSPNNPDLHCELGVLCLRNGQEGQGLYWLNSALRLNPTHAGASQALADYQKRVFDRRAAQGHRGQPR